MGQTLVAKGLNLAQLPRAKGVLVCRLEPGNWGRERRDYLHGDSEGPAAAVGPCDSHSKPYRCP